MVRTLTSVRQQKAMAHHQARADLLLERAIFINSQKDLEHWRELRRVWARDCAATLREVFECEAVAEFAHALAPPAAREDWRASARAEQTATSRATDLLRSLRGTV
jgi:hypothetical protein